MPQAGKIPFSFPVKGFYYCIFHKIVVKEGLKRTA
jgi:hypothetical protein